MCLTRFRTFLLLLALLSGILVLLMSSNADIPSAQARGVTTLTTRATQSNSVTILILDMSGSMAGNDSAGVRCSAANAYIDLAGQQNFIGVVGLAHQGSGTGSHNFQDAQVWAQPMNMATLAERQQLQNIIATKSDRCRPDGGTPTYDALDKALQMLISATNNGQISGSVVLLTDGVPDPDTVPQMDAIQSDLLPLFKQHKWAIDTVALGADASVAGTHTTFHGFLSNLSDTTSGVFYDDGHGVVSGISPLNIADFFVNIFALHNQRIVNHDLPPTALDGGITKRNFSVTDYTNSLDVVVVKDKSSTTASLLTPNGQLINKSGPGVFVSDADPHYVIFSITHPQAGTWELDVTGSGQFLMDSLKTSGIGLSTINISQANLSAAANAALALGQPLSVSANLTYNGQQITDNRFALAGSISYQGALGQYSQSFSLSDGSSPGTYMGQVTVPTTAPPGTYLIAINASEVSGEAIVASQHLLQRIELFPQPVINSTQATSVQWDPVLSHLYSLSFWPLDQLGQLALAGLPGQGVSLAGQVELRQQPYVGATVTAISNAAGSSNSIPVSVINDGNGRFHLLLPSATSGTYLLTFETSGSTANSHGDFGQTRQTIQITLISATLWQELHAWLLTIIYLLCLLFLFYLARWFVYPHPQGNWLRYHEGEIVENADFRRASRNPWQGFIHRDWLYSRQARMPAGVHFRFRHSGGIEARAEGSGSANWQWGDGSALPGNFREVRELRYSPHQDADEHNDDEESSTFVFTTQGKVKTRPATFEREFENNNPRLRRTDRRHQSSARARKQERSSSRNEDLF